MINQCQTVSFKAQILEGVHDLLVDQIKIALYTGNANLTVDTLIYDPTNEVVSANYTPGGEVLQNVSISKSGSTAYVNFSNVQWNNVAFTCRGALIYNASKGNKSIAVLNFGSDKSCSNTFTITMPANTVSTALLRIA